MPSRFQAAVTAGQRPPLQQLNNNSKRWFRPHPNTLDHHQRKVQKKRKRVVRGNRRRPISRRRCDEKRKKFVNSRSEKRRRGHRPVDWVRVV